MSPILELILYARRPGKPLPSDSRYLTYPLRVVETLRLIVRNSVCSGWEHEVKHALRQIDGVQGVTASYKANLVGITFDAARVTGAALKERVESLGYDVVVCG